MRSWVCYRISSSVTSFLSLHCMFQSGMWAFKSPTSITLPLMILSQFASANTVLLVSIPTLFQVCPLMVVTYIHISCPLFSSHSFFQFPNIQNLNVQVVDYVGPCFHYIPVLFGDTYPYRHLLFHLLSHSSPSNHVSRGREYTLTVVFFLYVHYSRTNFLHSLEDSDCVASQHQILVIVVPYRMWAWAIFAP